MWESSTIAESNMMYSSISQRKKNEISNCNMIHQCIVGLDPAPIEGSGTISFDVTGKGPLYLVCELNLICVHLMLKAKWTSYHVLSCIIAPVQDGNLVELSIVLFFSYIFLYHQCLLTLCKDLLLHSCYFSIPMLNQQTYKTHQ